MHLKLKYLPQVLYFLLDCISFSPSLKNNLTQYIDEGLVNYWILINVVLKIDIWVISNISYEILNNGSGMTDFL